MAQVVNSENLIEFVKTGVAPEFKKPEAEAKPAEGASTSDGTTVQPRKADGTFDSPSGEKSPPEKGKAAPQPADDHDPDADNLTEHAKRVIGKKHRQMKEAQEFGVTEGRRALAAEARAEALQAQLDALQKGTKSGDGPAPAKGSDGEPNPDDFKTVGEYTRALTKYEVAKAAREAGEAGKRQSEQDRAKNAAEELAGTFANRQDEFKKATPDYEAVIGDSELDMPNAGMQYIVESEMGPQLAYHLAKNPSVAERLSSLSPARVIAELGKLEARLESEAKSKDPPKVDPPTQNTRQVSRAPAPVQPLNTDAATAVQKDPAQMSFSELRAYREQQRKQGQYRAG